jgi:hypothetical protein
MNKQVGNEGEPSNQCAPLLLLAPILPGKAEAWRRFMQEMSGARHGDYEASRRRLGIRAERVWISETRHGALGLWQMEAAAPAVILTALATADTPFDRWFRQQVQAILAIKLAQVNQTARADLIFAWSDFPEVQSVVSNNSSNQGIYSASGCNALAGARSFQADR